MAWKKKNSKLRNWTEISFETERDRNRKWELNGYRRFGSIPRRDNIRLMSYLRHFYFFCNLKIIHVVKANTCLYTGIIGEKGLGKQQKSIMKKIGRYGVLVVWWTAAVDTQANPKCPFMHHSCLQVPGRRPIKTNLVRRPQKHPVLTKINIKKKNHYLLLNKAILVQLWKNEKFIWD